MHLNLSRIVFVVFMLALMGCSSTKRMSDKEIHHVYLGEDHCRNSNYVNSLFAKYNKIHLTLDEGIIYYYGDLVAFNNSLVIIDGNNATIRIPDGQAVQSLIKMVDIGEVVIHDVTFEGNYINAECENYLIKIHTPSNVTKSIVIDNVSVVDADNGGMMIQNIYKPYGYKDWDCGAENVTISNCEFHNVGKFAAINIRGSHKSVLIENCIGTDRLSRQHFSMGKMFEFSAEVGQPSDMVGKVLIKNSSIIASNKGLFAQQVEDFQVKNFRVDSMGVKPVYYPNSQKPVGVVAIKIDDLGLGNTAVLDSFFVTNTAKSPYRVFLAIEESDVIGHTSKVRVNYFESDVTIRLGASGNHEILGGKIYDASISFISKHNLVQNVKFYGREDHFGIQLIDTNNSIKDCSFYNSQIVNYKQAKANRLSNCHLLQGDLIKHWILFDLNNPEDPNELSVENCSAVDGVVGIWSGGAPKQSKNLKLSISRSPSLSISKNILEHSKMRKF